MLCTSSFVALSACLLLPTVIASAAPSAFDLAKFHPKDIIRRDVAVIGGGAAGTYSAISLKDKGKSVILVEKKDRIGGHTETYIDPVTGTKIDIGVMIFHDIPIVRDYFKRFDLPLEKSPGFLQSPLNYDFRTGKQVNLSLTPPESEVNTALATYAEQLSKYPKLEDGIFLPDPVPEDLYMPFGDFVKKYKIQAAVPTMFNYNPGVGNMLEIPTLEQFRYWGLKFLHSFTDDFLMTAHRNASELYSKAQAELSSSSSVLLNSEVAHADRGKDGEDVKLILRTSTGKNKLILAKKLLVAIPPKLDFVSPLDLGDSEKALFGKYIDSGYYVGLIRNTGFPDDKSISNAGPDTEYNFPYLPGAYSFAPVGLPSYQMVTYATPQSRKSFPMSDREVKEDIIRTVKMLQKQNPDKFASQGEPKWVDFRSHAPYSLQVKGEDIKDGFYKKLYALQGQRNTYWTGAAFLAEDSSALWQLSEDIVLPQLLASL